MNPITEALEIIESMMLNKNRDGLGRLHRLLTAVKDNYFIDDGDDTAALPLWFSDEPPFPAA